MPGDVTLPLVVNDAVTAAGTVATKWPGGEGAWITRATFGGGNITLEYQDPAGTWVAVTAAATTAGYTIVKIPPGQVRSVVTTATSAFSYLVGVRT